ncbi:cation-translocating P-type ATPase [Jiangella mangrovi]|uniref:Magnesium-transporting ATPase (P-type) n=1 Tax=Jiangella mangrovi TaxID=1524084 RepID=A0A7W9GSA5_9ACTN|nr:HAD-IC family P-type ATPase [Jiangella mangrovi]MBB5788829.1 magnesium-transporting ATPase (P-type) [Jiangella mangrovi]
MPPSARTADAVVDAPWSLPPAEVLAAVGSRPTGLTADEAERRLERFGPNRLAPPTRTPWWRRVLAQFDDTLIYILLVAAAFKAVLADWVDFAVILGVAVINAAIGLVQEGRAERALDAIKNMLSVRAHVVRSGTVIDVDADQLVPGDVVRVRPGDRVPADVRLLESTGLQAEESALTGESVPAAKDVHEVRADAGLGDRHGMLYSGTLIVAGTGTGVVVASGQDTEIGKVQTMISQVEGVDTPLTRSLDSLGKKLAVVILVMALVMIVIGRVLHEFEVPDLVSAAIGFAVAAVPEGLPALVTITLALGVQQMARRRAITRKLPSVETLGAVTTICSDKTGTLTRNEMTARMVRTGGARFEVSGLGYAPVGEVTLGGDVVTVADRPDLARLIEDMSICNDATVVEDGSQWRLVGEPTEGALSVLGPKAGFAADGWRRVAEVPFDPATKYMGVLASDPGGTLRVLVKGAPDRVLERCGSQTGPTGDPEPLDREFWESQIDEIGADGLRVLAAAHARPVPGTSTLTHADLDGGLELAGLVGIVDPPRPEAVDAITVCRTAGVRVKMITGDHAGTALAIGREMGIAAQDTNRVLSGADLEAMSAETLRATVRDVDIYARTSPEHKLRIVAALQAHGEVVAMTGDGVNDAPALTRADVGVAMGIKGTEATKEAADIVLADDNFATIERAVEEGRRIYDNVRRSLLFLLPTNGAQSLVILIAVLFGLTLPLQPVQVLWINMVTSVTLGLALANERAEHDIMSRPPRRARESIVPLASLGRIAVVAALIGSAAMGVFYYEHARGVPLAEAQTTAVTMLALGQLAYLFNCRFLDRSSLTPAVLRGNRAVWWSAGAMIGLQLLFCYAPFAHTWFGSAPIGPREWAMTAVLAVMIFLLTEAAKAITRSRTRTATELSPKTSNI